MIINVTYLFHSGFLVEWDTCYWLFDYYKGQIPGLDNNKMMVIFVSHNHHDHFNPEIFKLYKKHPKITYLISSDVKINDETMDKYGISEEIYRLIKVVKPNQEYEVSDGYDNDIHIRTLKSTDSGVAFVNRYQGKTIYHAGDLNLWVWKGEGKQYNNDMKAKFKKEMLKLENTTIDVAFTPLDPRQEEWYGLGMDELLDTSVINYLFPMHFWEKPEIIQQYKDEVKAKKLSTTIMDVKEQGQTWNIEI